jgi:hypothetical protein
VELAVDRVAVGVEQLAVAVAIGTISEPAAKSSARAAGVAAVAAPSAAAASSVRPGAEAERGRRRRRSVWSILPVYIIGTNRRVAVTVPFPRRAGCDRVGAVRTSLAAPLAIALAAVVGCACGEDAAVAEPPVGGSAASAGAAAAAGAGGTAGDDGGGGTANVIVQPDAGSDAPDGADPCSSETCSADQHCEPVDGGAECVPNDCASLACDPTEKCVATDAGAHCESNACTSDVECAQNEWCDGQQCVADVCTPGETRCQGQDVYECDANGGGESVVYGCGSGSPYFQSVCEDTGSGDAGCPCEDDWDCPAWTECDAGRCRGTGLAPTCSLPPEPFTNVLPVNEIRWGGTQADPRAVGSPFEPSTQVVMAPLVANLDDDNHDGVIDERDFPEIVFATFCGSSYTSDGTLRAIHGGGPNKGKDYFATCGGTTWREGDALPASCNCNDAILDATASLAVGDLDYDGVPEIVGITEGDGIAIFDATGGVISTSANLTPGFGGANPAPSLANVDNQGLVEIVVGRSVFSLEKDATGRLVVLDRFQGAASHGTNGQGPVSCVANLLGDSRQEIVAGTSVYRFPAAPPGAQKRADCTGAEVDPDEVAWCGGVLPIAWDARAIDPAVVAEGFCAVADILGADQVDAPGPQNPLDGLAEVITISDGNLQVLNGQDGTLRRKLALGAGSNGGPPNVDDFDGDGFPEVGSAFGAAYLMIDLQAATTGGACDAWPNVQPDDAQPVAAANVPRTPPAASCAQDADCGDPGTFACNETTATCVCLHNGWRRRTEDDSSRVTGSTVFDFNGDGAAEAIYNDECNFRVYDGIDGDVYFKEPSESRTRIEYPIVADVDNDGNAEIVFATTTESGFCSENQDGLYNAGIEAWGDASDLWVSARRVWNQHAYHVTNVTESGRVPVFEPESWRPYNGRRYDTYRSNPRSFGVAPDLTVQALQVSSPDTGCGQLSDQIEIGVQIANAGDLRVGPGVVVSFHGEWPAVPLAEPLNDAGGAPLTVTLATSLEPGDVILLQVSYAAANNSPGVLPAKLRVVVDDGDQERECVETNNELEKDVIAGGPLADLRVELGVIDAATCPTPEVPTTVHNDGTAPASGVVVRYFAGDPGAGGTLLHDEPVPGTIGPGQSVSFTAVLPSFPKNAPVVVWAVVDPDDVVDECNDANNSDAANAVKCDSVQ